ncbi:uncharacterized protein PG986_007921 [Apiospora aurea]|uniref:Uncharacterized protein n=1 Tax=Apiospora aurea TaxID=335848 RepID=A0ABR1QDZ4_9PEZI
MDDTPAGDHFKEQATIDSLPVQVDIAEKVPVDQEPQDTTELPPTQVEAAEKEPAGQHLQEQTTVESQPVVSGNSVEETASETVVPIKKSKKKKNKKSQSTIEPTSDSLVPPLNEPLQDVTVADAPSQPQPDETSRPAALPSADVPKPDDARQAESVPLGESVPVTSSATRQSTPELDYLPSAPGVHLRPKDSVGAPREIYFPSALSMLPAVNALQGHRYPAQAETKSSEQQGPPSELDEGKNMPEEPHGWAEDSDRRGEPGELGTEALRTTPAPVHVTTGFDGPDLSQDKPTKPTVAEDVEGAPSQARTQPDLFSGEEELQRGPGRLGLADPPLGPLPSVEPVDLGLVRDAGDLPAQPPMAVAENDAPAGDITGPSTTPSTHDGSKTSIDISDVKEDSGGSKKGKKNKKKKRQSATESLDPPPEAPSRAIEPVEEPLSQTSPSVERPIGPEPIAVALEPSSCIEDQPVERHDTVDADGPASMAKKAKKSQKGSQILNDLSETAPSVEEPMTESAKDDAVTTQEDVAFKSTPAPITNADEAQPEEEWAPVKRSKKDKKKNKASSVLLDTEAPSEPTTVAEDPLLEPAASTEPPVNVDDQVTKDETSSKEVVADGEWSAIPSKKSKKKAQASLSDEVEEKSADVAVEPTPEEASEQASVSVPEPALEPTPEHEVPPPSEEVVEPGDDVGAAPATPKKSKKDKKKRKSVTFADSAEEQPMVSLENVQDDVANSGPIDETVPADLEAKPEPVAFSDVPIGESSSSGSLENKGEQAQSVPASEPLELLNPEPGESTSQAATNKDISAVSPDDEFPTVTKKSKKDKKKAKRKSQEQELDITVPEMSAALDETVSTTGQPAEIPRDVGNSSALTQDESTPAQAIAETTALDEPEQVKAGESIVEVPSERPQSPSAAPEATDKPSAEIRNLPNQDNPNIDQPLGHSTDTPAGQSAEQPIEQPEEQPVQTHDDEFTVVPTKKSKKDKKKKSSQAQLPDSSSVETPTEQQSFLAPGQPSEKEPSATEPWVTEDIAGPSEEQPVEEHTNQDGTIVADKSTLKAGLETSEVAHEASSTLAEPASVGSNITTVPVLQSTPEDQAKQETLQQYRALPEQTNTLDTVAEDEWGISSPAKSKKDKKKEKGAELTSEEPSIAPTEEASAPSSLVEAPIEVPLSEGAALDQSTAPSFEDKSGAGPSDELLASDRPEPEVVSPKKPKKDKKKKRQTSSWEEELGELPTPSENEPVILPSDTAPRQVDEVVVAEAPSGEHKEADALSADEKKDESLDEQAVDAPRDKSKEALEDFAPVKKSKKEKKKKRQASPWEDEVLQEAAPEPSEMASTLVEESPSQPIEISSESANKVPSETVYELAHMPVEEETLSIAETPKDEEVSLEDPGQHPPVSGESFDTKAVEATPVPDDVQQEATADKETESQQAPGTTLPAESDTKEVTKDAFPEYTSSKKSKDKKKKRSAKPHDDPESVPVTTVEESEPIQDPRGAPLATDETVAEAVVSEEGPKELDVKKSTGDVTAEESLSATDRFNPETEPSESAASKKSKTDQEAPREQDGQEPLPSLPTDAEPSTAQAQGQGPVDIPIHLEKFPNEPMPAEPSKEPLAEEQSVPEEQPALQEHPLPQDASVSEELLTDPTLENTATKDSTVPSNDLIGKEGSDTANATPQALVDQPRGIVHSLGDQTAGLPEGGQPTQEQAPANDLATELSVDAPTQPQVEDMMTSKLPIRVSSRTVQTPTSAATPDGSASASRQPQKPEDAIEATERELQSEVPNEKPVGADASIAEQDTVPRDSSITQQIDTIPAEDEWADSFNATKSKEDKKKGKGKFQLELERILSRQVTSRQVPVNPKGARTEVTERKQIDPSEELPTTLAAAEWADTGATEKDTALLEPEPASREQMPDTQHSLATQDIVVHDDTPKALLPEPATDDLLPDEPTESEGAATTSKREGRDKKRKSRLLPETGPEPVAEVHAPSEEPGSLGVEKDDTVSFGVPTERMMVDQPQADAPTSTELAPTQPTYTEAEMSNPTPATPEKATSQHRHVSGPVNVDLSPAQLSSHIDHEPPFDQSTQPGKKVRMQSFLDDAVIPEPIAATHEPTPEPMEHPAQEVEAPLPSNAAIDENSQRQEAPQADSMAREIAASYFEQPASGGKSRSRRAPRGQDMPNLDMRHNALPVLTPQRDLAVSYFEKGPGNRQKSIQGDQHTSTEDAQRGTDEAEALLAANALAGGVEKMTEQFGSPKKTEDQKKSENTGKKTSLEGDHTPDTIAESPIVGRGQKTGSATDRSFPSKDTMQESRDFQDSQNSELIRDIEELDTSEPQAQSDNADYQSPGAVSSHDTAGFSRRKSTMSMRSLPPVEEETHEELEDDVRRDSGFMADSPNPMRHKQFEDDTQRDSGVHLRDWAEKTATRRPEGRSTLDEGARLSWASTDSRGTPKWEEGRLKKSPLGDDVPRLSQYSVRSGSRSPPSDKSDTLDPRKARAPGPVQRTPSPEYQQRSVSDNVRHFEGSARGEQEAPAPARRSVSNTSISRGRAPRTPEPHKLRPESPGVDSPHSSGANTPPLRRRERMSGDRDLRSLGQHGSQSSLHSLASRGRASEPDLLATHNNSSTYGSSKTAVAAATATDRHRAAQNTTPVANEGRVRASRDMAEIYVSGLSPALIDRSDLLFLFAFKVECLLTFVLFSPQDGMGEGRIGSPRSPTRPHSMRRRQSMQVLELESRVEQLIAENRALAEARLYAESHGNQRAAVTVTERDAEIEQLKSALDGLRREVQRLTEVNTGLNSANAQLAVQHNDRYSRLQSQHSSAAQELEQVRGQYDQTLREKDAEIQNLLQQLEATKQQVRQLQQQILATKPADADFLRLKDEDHFDHRCQQLCSHVQQWVLRFSKFSDMRACRLTSEINDEKIIDRLDNSMLDGTDVDEYLSDRVRRRDVFMSMTMNMIWEFVFTRYLFGMDREQRQKLKSLEKLLSDRPAFGNQRNEDTEAVVQAILQTLSMILPPPSNLEDQIQSQLRRVMREAVDLSIEMRTQRAEYMMLPPLQPQYDASGDIAETVTFNAALMNERSGSSTSNEEFEAQGALIRSVLFPLVVKKGNDNGVGEDEIVIFPAQVLVAKPRQPASRMVTPSSENGGVPLSRGTTPLSRKTTPSVIAKSIASLPMSPRHSPAGSR